MRVFAHQRVADLVRVGDMAGDLRRGDFLGERRKGLRRLVAVLPLKLGIVDRRPVEPGWRAGLEAAEREAERVERSGERDGGLVAHAASGHALFAQMDHAAQERAGGDHHGPAGDLASVGERDAGHAGGADLQSGRFGLDHGQAGRLRDERLHRQSIELTVGLGAWALHGGTLAAVEHTELDAAAIGRLGHQPVQRVDLAHEMAFAESADGGVAGHDADRRRPRRHERRLRADARGGRRRLAAGVPAAYHDDVEAVRTCFT